MWSQRSTGLNRSSCRPLANIAPPFQCLVLHPRWSSCDPLLWYLSTAHPPQPLIMPPLPSDRHTLPPISTRKGCGVRAESWLSLMRPLFVLSLYAHDCCCCCCSAEEEEEEEEEEDEERQLSLPVLLHLQHSAHTSQHQAAKHQEVIWPPVGASSRRPPFLWLQWASLSN